MAIEQIIERVDIMQRARFPVGTAFTFSLIVGAAGVGLQPIGTALAAPQSTRFVCSGVFSSGSGMAGSSLEKDGKPTCFFEADTDAEAKVQRECGQNAVCDVTAITRTEGNSRIVEQVLSVKRLGGPADDRSTRAANEAPPLVDPGACPSSEFETFAKKFASRISIQSHFTRWPLAVTRIDAAAQPEPKPVTKQVAEQKMSYPLMMDIERAKREGKVVRIDQDNKTTGHVEYSGSDNGQKIRYLFQRSGSCWQLVAIDDQSL
ncbi:hypothetical protein [Burkholderia sp. BCC1993]|uniref:hypothetical protein n=1 Tax=Burkholderia sp. BCC1993 TaxID=2817444 RepID=UPI002AB015D1|nr:hypothetical protein [Burkholderia sp. BCC1993]